METFLQLLFWPDDNRLMTFVIILSLGLIWIYFRIPAIKKKVELPPEKQSSRDEWQDSIQAINKTSLILFLTGVGLCLGIYSYEPDGERDSIVYFLVGMTMISFATAVAMQMLNKMVKKTHLNN